MEINKKINEKNIRFENLLLFFKPTIDLLSSINVEYMIGGGCIRDYFTSTKITDIDIFTPNRYNQLMILSFFLNNGAEIILNNDKVVKLKYNNITYDIIKMNFDNPTTLLNSFDFTVCQFCIDYNLCFYYSEESFIDLSKRQLMISNLPYPESTMLRVNKYNNKGFRICNEELTKIINSIKNVNVNLHPYNIKTYTSENYSNFENNVKVKNDDNNTFVNDDLINKILEEFNFDLNLFNNESNESSQYTFYGID